MFNKTIIQKGHTEYVPYEKTIHEHRAPTDESVRLLNEMQDKAMDNIMQKIILNDNMFKGVVYVVNSPMADGFQIYIRFTLNGVSREIKDIISRMDMYEKQLTDSGKLIDYCIEKFSKILACELIANFGGMKEVIKIKEF